VEPGEEFIHPKKIRSLLANREEIMRPIPQRPPMVMIDELLACDARHIVTGFRVDAGNVFGQHGIFTEPGLIENITS